MFFTSASGLVAQYNIVVSLVLTDWRYCSLALSPQCYASETGARSFQFEGLVQNFTVPPLLIHWSYHSLVLSHRDTPRGPSFICHWAVQGAATRRPASVVPPVLGNISMVPQRATPPAAHRLRGRSAGCLGHQGAMRGSGSSCCR